MLLLVLVSCCLQGAAVSFAQDEQTTRPDAGKPLTQAEIDSFCEKWMDRFAKEFPNRAVHVNTAKFYEVYGDMVEQVVLWDSHAKPLLLHMLSSDAGQLHHSALTLIDVLEVPHQPYEYYYSEDRDRWPYRRLGWVGEIAESLVGRSRADSAVAVELAVRHCADAGPIMAKAFQYPLLRHTVLSNMRWCMSRDNPVAREMVTRGLEDGLAWVRTMAIAAALNMNMRSTVPDLAGLLEDKEEMMPSFGRHFMTQRPLESFNPEELKHAKNWNPQLRHAAVYAIQKLTGKDYGFVAAYDSREDMDEIVKRIREDYPQD